MCCKCVHFFYLMYIFLTFFMTFDPWPVLFFWMGKGNRNQCCCYFISRLPFILSFFLSSLYHLRFCTSIFHHLSFLPSLHLFLSVYQSSLLSLPFSLSLSHSRSLSLTLSLSLSLSLSFIMEGHPCSCPPRRSSGLLPAVGPSLVCIYKPCCTQRPLT